LQGDECHFVILSLCHFSSEKITTPCSVLRNILYLCNREQSIGINLYFKYMMRKYIFLFILLSSPLLAGAEEVEIDGLWYNLISKAKQAEVIKYKTNKYLGDIVIPDMIIYQNVSYSVIEIGDNAFNSCNGLTSITIANSINRIGIKAFAGCTGLSSIIIPNNVSNIGGGAFSGCEGLTSITIPNSVTSIDNNTFSDCSSLISIVIPDGVTFIGGHTFHSCTSLASVTIPNSVTRIDRLAFYACKSLTSITIPNSVTTIDYNAFQNCI
jgi:hypothetical protein